MIVDTLQISESLKKAGADSKIAKELAQQFKLIREDIITKEEAEQRLATKQDIKELELKISETTLKISKSRNSLLKWMIGLFVGLFIGLTGTISAICFTMIKTLAN